MKSKLLAVLMVVLLLGMSLAACGEEKEVEVYQWPDTELGNLLPEIKAEVTDLSSDEETLSATMKITQEQWKAYVEKCREAGFTEKESYSEGDYCDFTARNKDSYELNLSYDNEEGSCDLYLYSSAYIKELDKEADEAEKESEKQEAEEKAKEEKKASEKAKKKSGSGDFKKMMDDYEAFMDKYVEFMKKYENSDDVTSMIDDYSDMLDDYQKYTEKIDDVDTDNLSNEELAYYNEVTSRVAKKLADI